MFRSHPSWVIKSIIYRIGILSISLLTAGCVSTSNVVIAIFLIAVAGFTLRSYMKKKKHTEGE